MQDKPASPPPDDLVDRLVVMDQRLSGEEAASLVGSTAAVDETVDPQVTDCLRLLDRVRKEAALWPGSSEGLQWLYSDSLTPQRLGRFEVCRRLGMGGFGIVFLARDPSLGRDVALKVPRLESMVSPEARKRFLRESRLAASLAHENIAAVYEAGIIEPVAYLASAYCPGGSIAELLHAHGPFPPQAAARLMVAIAEAVQHAHSRGVLHRDIKPSNILLDAPDSDMAPLIKFPERLARAARLVDFGLARSLDDENTSESLHEPTRTGAMVGTPAFMAPEQVAGRREQVTEAADVYGLGATLYCLLVGEPPFRRATDWDTLQAVQREEAHAPSRHAADIPRDLDAICLKCLEKDPDRRYRSAGELERDLQRFLSGEPILARRLTGLQRAARWSRRNPALATSLSLLAIVLVVATTVSTIFWRRSAIAERIAKRQEAATVASARQAQEQARHARQAVDQLLTAIAEEPSIRSAGLEEFRQRLLSTANAFYLQLRERQPNDAEVVAELIETTCRLATIHRLLGDHQRAVELWQDAARDALQSLPQETSRLAVLLGSRAQELDAVGLHVDAVALAEQAIELQRSACEQDNSDAARTELVKLLVNYAQVLLTDAGHEQANELLDEAIQLVNAMTGQPPAQWPICKLWGILLRDKACALSGVARYQDSNSMAQIAMRIIEEHMDLVPNDRSACMMHQAALHKTLGYNRMSTGELEAAEREYRDAWQLAQQLVQRHPQVGMLYDYLAESNYNLAHVLFQRGQTDDARHLLNENLARIANGQTHYPDLSSQWDRRRLETEELLRRINASEKQSAEQVERKIDAPVPNP